MKLRVLSLAEADLLSGFRFYESQQEGLGEYFLGSLYSDIDSLHLFAGVHRKMHGYHRLLSKRFPFAVYYDFTGDDIRVWRVLDCRRNPHWIGVQLRRTRKINPSA